MLRNFLFLAVSLLRASASPDALDSCVKDPAEWTTFEAHVIAREGDTAATTAKDKLQSALCAEFDISPCVVTEATDDEYNVTISGNLIVRIPRSRFADVAPWLMQERWSFVSGAGPDLDLLVYPVSGCGAAVDAANFSVAVGDRFPYSPAHLYQATRTPNLREDQGLIGDDSDSWAATCSEDCSDDDNLCDEPFANHTTCSAAADVQGFHVHLFYFQNTNRSIYGKEDLFEALALEFSLDWDNLCPDTHGHEQSHNETCLLTGPEGEWTVNAAPSGSSSFTYGCSSVYVHKEDFIDVLSWLLFYKNGAFRGMSFDFLVHPATGCNFADHYEFSLSAGTPIPNNNFAIAEEGGWTDTTSASPLDKFSSAAVDRITALSSQPAPDPFLGCDLDTADFHMHVLYDPSDEDAVKTKDCVVSALLDISDVMFMEDDAAAFSDPDKPFFTAEASLKLPRDRLETAIPVAMSHRADAGRVDLLLAPQTGCPLYDYGSWSLYGGRRWKMDLSALSLTDHDGTTTTHSPTATSSGKCPAAHSKQKDPTAFLIYALSAPNNAYQLAAHEAFLGNLSTSFGLTREACVSQYPSPEPTYTTENACMMQEIPDPYWSFDEVMTTTYGAVYVPLGRLGEVLGWAMTHRGSPTLSYDIDLHLVPLTASPRQDYGSAGSMRAGTPWRVNYDAL